MSPSLKTYLAETRDPYTNAILVLPLFVAYQIGILATGGVRNGVDFMTDYLFALAGNDYGVYIAINFGLVLALGVALIVLRKSGDFDASVWPWVIVESTVYGAFLGTAVVTIMQQFGLGELLASGAAGQLGTFDKLVLSIGAGLYEELVFRLFLMGGLYLAVRRFTESSKWFAATVGVLLSSLAFSGIHYVGSMADTFALGSFLFRFLAGILLAVIFYLRGFAIAVYTHAIYDIFVMVF